ncbi:HK97 gp10 family phage protein [Diaphorobacter sp. HDW4B]|uniref:HK97 gp10 family phage protein n=1 Tax=Diaphorobacter sp. HDW4B TaxID=2714925 RepID=UPI00140B31D5|nr:HK97 gp10 family phage protein [Diaphorobacter sp. HDW4B]QIL69566.1 HK97 gp10 family phage protein [Diaphorobacter sp. HDW4B]
MAKLTGARTFTAEIDTSGLAAYLDQLGDEAEKAIRPAAQAGVQVLYERVQANVAQIGKKSGNLASSIYQVYSKTNSEEGRNAEYQVSWNRKKAPHGHLVEYGYLRRYRYYKGNDGQIRPMVRPGMEGKPKPGRRASAAQKAAYYVMLDTPVHVPGKFFVRNAATAFDAAYRAAENELLQRVLARAS